MSQRAGTLARQGRPSGAWHGQLPDHPCAFTTGQSCSQCGHRQTGWPLISVRSPVLPQFGHCAVSVYPCDTRGSMVCHPFAFAANLAPCGTTQDQRLKPGCCTTLTPSRRLARYLCCRMVGVAERVRDVGRPTRSPCDSRDRRPLPRHAWHLALLLVAGQGIIERGQEAGPLAAEHAVPRTAGG